MYSITSVVNVFEKETTGFGAPSVWIEVFTNKSAAEATLKTWGAVPMENEKDMFYANKNGHHFYYKITEHLVNDSL